MGRLKRSLLVSEPDPYVVALVVDDDVQDRWDALRAEHFPPGRTQVRAHVTLCHAIPADEVDPAAALEGATARPAFAVRVRAPMSLGRGTAFRLESAGLQRVHHGLQRTWWHHLSPQDRQGFRPHVTVQNKVTPDEARATLALLAQGFTPYDVTARGLDLFRYAGGPWEHVRRFPFQTPH